MSETDKIDVHIIHLQELYQALDAARTYHAALDLMDASRAVKVQSSTSRLSSALERSYGRVEGYLIDAGVIEVSDAEV